MEPKWSQNRTQDGPKSKIKTNRKKKILKIVLEPSWVDLGSSWVPSWGQNRALALGGARFFENRLFGEVRLQEATWTDLGPIWGAKRLQNGSQGGSKSEVS